MKITVKTLSEEAVADYDYRNYLSVSVDGKEEVSFFDGEPEDSNLSRDFSGCYSIPELMRKAYMAGVRGDGFEIEDVEVSEF